VGHVPIIEATVDIGPDGLPSAITGSLDLGTIDTGNTRRDSDLRKQGLLDLDHHPTITLAADAAPVSPASTR
jgi:polyisoprenoid-binding protein YceI